jgi:hypothetical protein
MVQHPEESKFRRRDALLLCLLLFVLYNLNLRLVRIDDSVPSRLLPFSLLLDHSFSLDGWVDPYLATATGPYGIYFVQKSQGHWMSTYPVINSLVVLPLYVIPAWWLSHQPLDPSTGDAVGRAVVDVMEKLSASLLAALSVGVLYLALRRIAPRSTSLLISLIYGMASSTWSISSQALWRHGLTELSFAFLLWALLRRPATGGYALGAGLALGLAAANKPAYAILAALFFIYFAREQRRQLGYFCVPMLVISSLLLAYNLHYFGRLLGAYPSIMAPPVAGSALSHYQPSTWNSLAGLLLSPNRGLLIYIPWVVFSLWGAVRIWKENTWHWGRYLLAGLAVVPLLHARFGSWWGGWSFGPRYLTDLLPFMAFFLVPVWPRIRASRWLRVALAAAVVAAVWVQVVGACYYPRGFWDGSPVSVDTDPRRLWDWSDTQISRSFRAGRAEPQLCYQLWTLFDWRNCTPLSAPPEKPPPKP